MEETYSIFHHVPYEGQSVVFSGTLGECRAWLLGRNTLYYSLDDLEIYSNNAPDIYELAAEC